MFSAGVVTDCFDGSVRFDFVLGIVLPVHDLDGNGVAIRRYLAGTFEDTFVHIPVVTTAKLVGDEVVIKQVVLNRSVSADNDKGQGDDDVPCR